jgi:hypothetical protein
MKRVHFFIGIIVSMLLMIVSYRATYALFSDTGISTSNTFAAASVFPTATPSATPTISITPTVSPTIPIAQTLVMNEILPVASCVSGQTNGQFLELWNGSGSAVDLQNFMLSDGTNTIAIANSNTSLPNGAFAILVKDVGIINQCLNNNVNNAVTVNLGGQIDLNAGTLQLLDSGSVVIDTLKWGTGQTLQPAVDQSIERIQIGYDSALGTSFNASDLNLQCPPTPGTWAEPVGGCRLVVNELNWAGSITEGELDEWIELRNLSSTPITLTGWKILGAATSGGDLTLTGVVPGNGLFLISNYNAANSAINVISDLVTTSVSLGNNAVQYKLTDNHNFLVDTIDDGSGIPLAGSNILTPTPAPKASMERNAIPGNGTLSGSWHTATTTVNFDAGVTDKGTPKAVND